MSERIWAGKGLDTHGSTPPLNGHAPEKGRSRWCPPVHQVNGYRAEKIRNPAPVERAWGGKRSLPRLRFGGERVSAGKMSFLCP